MAMHESYSKRLLLYTLLQTHPEWKQGQLVKTTGMPESWIKDWCRQLRPLVDAPFEDVYLLLQGRSCARKTPPARLEVEEILHIATLLVIRVNVEPKSARDDTDIAEHLTPPLTTVRVNKEAMETMEMKSLVARITDPQPVGVTTVLGVELVKRASVRSLHDDA